MAALIYPFLVLAGLGSAAVLMVHVEALLGTTYLFDHYLKYFGPGIFVVFVPTIFVMNYLVRYFKQKDVWRAALRGCPPWMRRLLWGVFGYAWVGFFALPFLYGGGMDSHPNQARAMSAVLLILYLIPLSVLYSAKQVPRLDLGRRCLNGHHLPPLTRFCQECGAPLDEQANIPEVR